jgi:dolichyl-phosphate-mannose--protein O-mannosyl transferase
LGYFSFFFSLIIFIIFIIFVHSESLISSQAGKSLLKNEFEEGLSEAAAKKKLAVKVWRFAFPNNPSVY